MTGRTSGTPAQHGNMNIEPQSNTRKWYFSRQEIDDSTPSRKDGIEFEKESHLRKSYCSFVHDLGMKLKVPQVTIACALMLCHRFYMRQSHAKNDWQTIATVSVFLASKIEETPRLLKDVVVVAYEILYKWDPSAPQRIRRREFYEKQKELILIGENLLLTTIAFDFNIQLPYKPLVDALKKLEIFPDLAKVAWNFINDWLCTTLCLQYKPHYIAAGSLFLAAKFKKVKLPTENGKVWWRQFDILPKQLEEVIQHMVRILEQDRKGALPPTNRKIAESSALMGKDIANSSQSTVSSTSSAGSHSSDAVATESVTLGERNTTGKENFPSQTSDSGASSIFEQRAKVVDLSSSSKRVSDHNPFCKLDADRIRERLKRKRCEGAANQVYSKTANAEEDGETWIERELENGIQL